MVEIIAEISGNHGGVLDNALRLIDIANTSGADAVKFQCLEPERLAIKRQGLVWKGVKLGYTELVDLYKKIHTPKRWFPDLVDHCNSVGIPWFSSVFDPEDVNFLEGLNCPRYKISAYEMLDGHLINAVVATGKPIIMSVRNTSRATILRATEYEGDTSPLGLSDHSKSTTNLMFSAYEALKEGAPIIERHICLPDVETEDTPFSSTPDEFSKYVSVIRAIRWP